MTRTIPVWLVYAAGWLMEMTYTAFRRPGRTADDAVRGARADDGRTWFDLTAARRDLGYEPKVSIEEGLRRLAASLKSSPQT